MEEKIVAPKDRDEFTNAFHIAMMVAGFHCKYQDADLIHQVYQDVVNRAGKTTVIEIGRIKSQWYEKWHDYFKNLE